MDTLYILGFNGAKINSMSDAMVNRPRDFKHHDVVRAFRAASAAGVSNPTLRIRLPSGTEFHLACGEVPDPGPKTSREHPTAASLAKGSGGANRAPLAKGGRGPDQHMFGKGDRTRTATADAAGEQKSRRDQKFAEGDSAHGMVKRQAADPADPGGTAKRHAAASPKQASGGVSKQAEESRAVGGAARPARAGECGT